MKHIQIAQIHNPVVSGGLAGTAGDTTADGGVALGMIMANLYEIIVVVGGLAVFIYLIWGGVNWIMAGGDKNRVEAARDKITNAVIGLGILVATIAIINVMSGVFGFDLLNPTIPGVQ